MIKEERILKIYLLSTLNFGCNQGSFCRFASSAFRILDLAKASFALLRRMPFRAANTHDDYFNDVQILKITIRSKNFKKLKRNQNDHLLCLYLLLDYLFLNLLN